MTRFALHIILAPLQIVGFLFGIVFVGLVSGAAMAEDSIEFILDDDL